MAVPHLLELRFLGMLARSGLMEPQRDLAVDLCADIVEMMLDLDVPDRGVAARSAARLMLEVDVPALDPGLRNDLARTCERAIVLAG
jgi:hypothetical protein